MLQEWRKPFLLPLDNLLEQVTLIIMMTVLYVDLASPTIDIVSENVMVLLGVIFAGVAARTVGPKYIGKVMKVLAYLPCCGKSSSTASEVEEGLFADADSLPAMERQENALSIE